MRTFEHMNYGLTPRDLVVLRDLARMRYLRTAQIQALHFPSRRVTNRRLEVLFREGYTDRFRLPTLIGQGSSEYIYCLEAKGGELLSALNGLEADQIQRPHRNGRPKNFFLMEHHLAINDFWIALEGACQNAGLQLARFIPEYYGEQTVNGGMRRLVTDSTPDPDKPGQKIWFTPDAMFILERAGNQALFFLEIDRGTEKITSSRHPAFTNKIRAYMSYFRRGGFKRWGEQFKGFRVLVVTSSVERQENLVLTARESGVQLLMWFTTVAQVTPCTILTEIWRLPDLKGCHALISGLAAQSKHTAECNIHHAGLPR